MAWQISSFFQIKLLMIVSDAISFISDTTSFTETLAETRALSFGISLTTANPRISPSACARYAGPIPMRPNHIRRKDRREVITYLLDPSSWLSEIYRTLAALTGSWLAGGSAGPSLSICESIGSVSLDCDVDIEVIRNIMNPVE